MENQVPASILAKIKKLLALANGAKEIGSLAEAEVAAAKASELMREYNIAISDVNLESGIPITSECMDAEEFLKKNEGQWILKLYSTIAYHNFCKVIVRVGYRQKTTGIRIVGEPMNIEMVKFIVDQLANNIRILAKKYWGIYDYEMGDNNPEKETKNTFIRGFYSGAASGIYKKLKDQENATKATEQANNQVGLMVVKHAAVDKWIEENLKIQNGGGPRKLSSDHGYGSGFAAGNKMNINKGLTNERGQKFIS